MKSQGVLWPVLLFLFDFAHLNNAFVPSLCASNLTNPDPICCPIPKDHTNPCGYPKFGMCLPTQSYRPGRWSPRRDAIYDSDFRFNWPKRLFHQKCDCRGRRWGYDCSKCWFGYEGPNCDKRKVRVRRNIKTYSKLEKKKFVDVLLMSRKVQSDYVFPIYKNGTILSGEFMKVDIMEEIDITHWYCGFGRLMNNNTKCHQMESMKINYGHYDSGFLTYHRYLMAYWESLLRDIAVRILGHSDFTFPYWDWFNMNECDICNKDLIGKGSDQIDPITNAALISSESPFGDINKWPVFCQNKAQVKSICAPCVIDRKKPARLTRSWAFHDFPTTEELIRLLGLTKLQDYDHPCVAFTNVLEAGWNCTCAFKRHPYGLHSNVHGFNLGTLSDLAASVFDPIFIFHHIQVDRIFERWFRGVIPHPRELPIIPIAAPECRECNIGTFFPTTTHRSIFGSGQMLGFRYDNLDMGPLSENVEVASYKNEGRDPKCPLRIVGLVEMLENKKL